jgi:tRNA (mo5U34)-methyltransferase
VDRLIRVNTDDDLTAMVEGREWYHTLELSPLVSTPGWFDSAKIVSRLPFPTSLEGKRCLDVGAFDGFWSFEMERRGASEVVAADILDIADWDWPAISRQADIDAIARRKGRGEGFDIARSALDSKVKRIEASIYDLNPEDHGTFDFVYLGSLLLHLRDPVGALERIHSVCSGQLLSVDAFDVGLTAIHPRRPIAHLDGANRPYWWKANLAGLAQMIRVAGFRIIVGPKPFLMPPGNGHPQPPLRASLFRTRQAREMFLASRFGDPHAMTLASPVTLDRPHRRRII